jgi:hypothetical protein
MLREQQLHKDALGCWLDINRYLATNWRDGAEYEERDMTPAAESALRQPIELSGTPAEESRMRHSTGTVRAMERSDLPAVADLFTRTFRKNNKKTDGQLAGYLETVFFGSPFTRRRSAALFTSTKNQGSTAPSWQCRWNSAFMAGR